MTIKEMLVEIGDRMREGRREKGFTQAELGREIGYSMNGIAKIERGETDPKLSSLIKIAAALEIDVGYLLGTGTKNDSRLLELLEASNANFTRLKALQEPK